MLVSGEMKAEKHVDSRFSNFWYAEKLKIYYKRQWQKVDGQKPKAKKKLAFEPKDQKLQLKQTCS